MALEEAESTAAALAAPRSSGAWKALAAFPLLWLGWWSLKGDLLTWLTRPVATAWFEGDPPPPTLFSSQLDMYGNLVRMCTTAAVVTVLPLLTRALLFRWRVPAAAFFGLSYAAIALASVAVRFALLPYLLRPVASETDGLLPMGEYLHVVCNLFAAQALGAQLAVVLLFLTRLRRARGETGARAILRLLGLCGGILLVGALLTPPDPFSHWLFSWPLIALHVLATLAGRVFGGSPVAPATSQG